MLTGWIKSRDRRTIAIQLFERVRTDVSGKSSSLVLHAAYCSYLRSSCLRVLATRAVWTAEADHLLVTIGVLHEAKVLQQSYLKGKKSWHIMVALENIIANTKKHHTVRRYPARCAQYHQNRSSISTSTLPSWPPPRCGTSLPATSCHLPRRRPPGHYHHSYLLL